MFSTDNQYFLQSLRRELRDNSEQEALLVFNERFKEQTFERIKKSYTEIPITDKASFYKDVLEQVGQYMIDELLIDIYLEDECLQIVSKVRESLYNVRSYISNSKFLDDLPIISSCKDFLEQELVKYIGVSDRDLHNSNQKQHPIIKKFAYSISNKLTDSKGEAELRMFLIHFIKFWSLLPTRTSSKNDKAILLLHYINSFIDSEMNNVCLNLKQTILDLTKYRLKNILSTPLISLGKGDSNLLPTGYFVLKERLLEKLERIDMLNYELAPDEALAFMIGHMNGSKVLQDEVMQDKVLGLVLKIKKYRIIKSSGLENLQKHQHDLFISKVLRKRYIIEAIME